MGNQMSKYVLIQNYIQEQIASGKLRPGDRIPSENELVKQFSVSRVTAASAIDHLRIRGLVVRIRGKGTFVKTPDASVFSLDAAPPLQSVKISAQNHMDYHQLLGLEVLEPEENSPVKLPMQPGEKCHRIRRLMLSESKNVIAVEDSFLPYSSYPRPINPEDIEQHYLHDFLRDRCHKEPCRLLTYIRITYPNELQQQYLRAYEDEPLLLWYSVVVDNAGQPLGYTATCARPDDYQAYLSLML